VREKKVSVYFATGRYQKFLEARETAAALGVRLVRLSGWKREIQSDDIREIASDAALEIASSTGLKVVTEDSGLFIDALNGFPGPYSSYVFRKLGLKGILKLLEGVEARSAQFRSVVAFSDAGGRPLCFEGKVKGTIAQEIRGSAGFGYDPIFIPASSDGRTFGEMTRMEKNTYSHRAKAFTQFAAWYARKSGLRSTNRLNRMRAFQ
jgi:XTP/dITP diphosphohydrolase